MAIHRTIAPNTKEDISMHSQRCKRANSLARSKGKRRSCQRSTYLISVNCAPLNALRFANVNKSKQDPLHSMGYKAKKSSDFYST